DSHAEQGLWAAAGRSLLHLDGDISTSYELPHTRLNTRIGVGSGNVVICNGRDVLLWDQGEFTPLVELDDELHRASCGRTVDHELWYTTDLDGVISFQWVGRPALEQPPPIAAEYLRDVVTTARGVTLQVERTDETEFLGLRDGAWE